MGYYKSEFKKLFREILLSPRTLSDRIFRVCVLGLPLAIYPIVLLSEDSDGKRLVSPHGVLGYVSTLLLTIAGTLIVNALGFFLAMTVTHGRKLRWVHFVLGMLGFRASATELMRVKQYTEMLRTVPLSLTTIDGSMVSARILNKFIKTVVPDFRYTPAWWRSSKLLREASELVATHMGFLETDDAFRSALQHTAEKRHEIFGESDKVLDQTLVYVPVTRGVFDINMLVLMNKYLVAGKNPLQWESRYGQSLYGESPKLVGMSPGYSALLCVPRWICEAQFALDLSNVENAPAKGTYKDTVAFLWNGNRSNFYHQPTTLVAAAKRLDKNRRGDLEYYID